MLPGAFASTQNRRPKGLISTNARNRPGARVSGTLASVFDDAEFCENVLDDGPGKLPNSFIRLAAACLALHQAAGADATAVVVKSHSAPFGGSSLAIEGHSSEAPWVSTLVILVATVAFAFICGCYFNSCARRCIRAAGAFFTEPANSPSKPTTRTVGTMSQCQYMWDLNTPRFRSETQGFRRAGEVTVEF